MARTFLYARVSTAGQTAENQIAEVKAAGFAVQPSRVITETISGSTLAMQRPAFHRLVDRLEADDVLVSPSSTAWAGTPWMYALRSMRSQRSGFGFIVLPWAAST